MTQPSFGNFFPAQASGNSVTAQDVLNKILECLAVLASGQNPDGTAFSITGVPTAANILTGYRNDGATGGAAFLTIPAGRTWQGWVTISVAVDVAAANTTESTIISVVQTAGTGVTPPAGNLNACSARAGASAASASPDASANSISFFATIIAPIGNSVTLQTNVTITGVGRSDVAAVGALVA